MPVVERRCILTTGPPWGFRVYKDSNDVLTISKVRRHSPAEIAKLRSGDQIISMNGRLASGLNHAEAITLIDTAVGTLDVEISRFESTSTQILTFNKMDSSIHEDLKTEMNVDLSRSNKKSEETEIKERTPTPEVIVTKESVSPDPIVRPSSPDVVPVPLSKLIKAYNINDDEDEHIPKKKHFADSSFYNDPSNLYPSTEEKIEMARRVASSLYAPDNKSSKGASIFEKQRKRADKYTLEKEENNLNSFATEEPKYDLAHWPEVIDHKERSPSPIYRLGYSSGPAVPPPPPPPPVPNEAKTIQEFMEKVQRFPKAKHNVVSPDVCFDIAAALHSSDSRGAQIFAKQKHRAQKWTLTAPDSGSAQPVVATLPGPSNRSKPTIMGEQKSKLAFVSNSPNSNQLYKNGNESQNVSVRKPSNVIHRNINEGSTEYGAGLSAANPPDLAQPPLPVNTSSTIPAAAKWKPVKFNVPQRA